jgi:hypothetical protein
MRYFIYPLLLLLACTTPDRKLPDSAEMLVAGAGARAIETRPTSDSVRSCLYSWAGATLDSSCSITRSRTDTIVDTLLVTLPSKPVTWASKCLAQTGPRITLTGTRTTRVDSRPPPKGTGPLAPGTVIDARGASWALTGSAGRFPLNHNAGCWVGGYTISPLGVDTTWDAYHSAQAQIVACAKGQTCIVEGFTAENYGDGITFAYGPNDASWEVRHSHLITSGDDCIENDALQAGLIEETYCDGAYVALSVRPIESQENTITGAGKLVKIRNSLFRMRQQRGVFVADSMKPPPPMPRFGQIFKVGVVRPDLNIGLDVEGSYFLLEGLGSSPGAMCLNQKNTLKRSVGNTLVWTGAGPYPCLPLPSGFTLTTDKTVWYAAEFAWYVNHQNLPTPVDRPIVVTGRF